MRAATPPTVAPTIAPVLFCEDVPWVPDGACDGDEAEVGDSEEVGIADADELEVFVV